MLLYLRFTRLPHVFYLDVVAACVDAVEAASVARDSIRAGVRQVARRNSRTAAHARQRSRRSRNGTRSSK
jgi:phage gp16-like protein